MSATMPQPDEVARTAMQALDARRQIAPFENLSVETAYRSAAIIRDTRIARGEKVVGRKIGFTNRTIWDEYGVHAPIWGYVYDRTLHALKDGARAADLVEPRIEPEIIFGLGGAVGPDMRPAEIAERIAWVAHGFEIVQSIFPGWRFALADTVAGFGLHGGLWLGPRRAMAPEDVRKLETFEIELFRNGDLVDRGRAANVLDGPLHALRYLAAVLRDDPDHAPLAAGEIVTTGTLTRAFPVAAGEVWTTRLAGIDLPGALLPVR
jgi:2-oxo-3-hexenedioate decarboxylase